MEGRNFIGGSWTAVAKTRPRENPANPGETVAVYPVSGKAEPRQAFDAAAGASEDGGRLLIGGEPVPGEGYFFAPTVIEGLPLTAPLAQEEVFGPVVTLHAVAGLTEALEGANTTRYGLSASISTRRLEVAEAFLEQVEAGRVHVNQPTAGVEYRVPFGGVKSSGYGPKEQGWSTFEFYSDWKTQVVRL